MTQKFRASLCHAPLLFFHGYDYAKLADIAPNPAQFAAHQRQPPTGDHSKMPNDPRRNPTLPGQGGRTHRHVEHSHTIRTVRTDATAEQHLQTLGEVLRGYEATDTVSVSMLLRRALAVYVDHVAAVEATPALYEEEMKRVREGSVIPSGHRKYAHKPIEKRMQGRRRS